MVIEKAGKHGFKHYIPLVFIKHHSPQALKANMRVVGATEYALLLYRSYLPKFRNKHYIGDDGQDHGTMVFNWFEWQRDGKDIPKVHPTQKPVALLKTLIELFTDEGDVVIDPVAGSGSTLRAAIELNRNAYGFEVGKQQYIKTMESGILDYEPPKTTQLTIEEALNG